MLDEILRFNQEFVARKDYLPYQTTKYPDRKLAILTCMDTRLTHLLPAALGLKNGEVKLIKNAGGVVLAPYGGVVRSLLVAVLELGVEEILVIGHTDCGVCGMRPRVMREHLVARGIAPETLAEIDRSGAVDLDAWFTGFSGEEQAVRDSVAILRSHPLMPRDVAIHGLIIDSNTGALRPLDVQTKNKKFCLTPGGRCGILIEHLNEIGATSPMPEWRNWQTPGT